MYSRFFWAVLIVVGLTGCGSKPPTAKVELATLLDDASADLFQHAEEPRPFSFPQDHGAHKKFRQEWWYLSSILRTNEGREFGAQFTLFRFALNPDTDTEDWRSNQLYLAHVAISDVAEERHVDFERASKGHRELAQVAINPFDLNIDGWRLQSTSDTFAPLRLEVKNRDVEILLSLDMVKPVVAHGNSGLSRKSPTNASFYYSIPRLETNGYLTIEYDTYKVSGRSWFDHEWSSGFLSSRFNGWDWLYLNMDDGRDYVLFSVRSKHDGTHEYSTGAEIDANGDIRMMATSEWSFKPLRYWKTYPVEWQIDIESHSMHVRPAFDDQSMKTSIQYWEGLVHAYENERKVGEGYLELTGY